VKTGELLDGPIFATEEGITEEGLAASSAKIFPAFAVIVAMYGANIGQLAVLVRPAATNQACCAVIPHEGEQAGWAYAYLTLSSHRNRLIGLRAGAAQQNISQATIKNFSVLLPTPPLLRHFETTASPFLRQAFLLHQHNANLSAQRDLLLPRLISGELLVAERELEAAA
jgi:type I restriction enzyme S subunit